MHALRGEHVSTFDWRAERAQMIPSTRLGCVSLAQSSLFTRWLALNTTAERVPCSVLGYCGIEYPAVLASRLQSSGDHRGVSQNGKPPPCEGSSA